MVNCYNNGSKWILTPGIHTLVQFPSTLMLVLVMWLAVANGHQQPWCRKRIVPCLCLLSWNNPQPSHQFTVAAWVNPDETTWPPHRTVGSKIVFFTSLSFGEVDNMVSYSSLLPQNLLNCLEFFFPQNIFIDINFIFPITLLGKYYYHFLFICYYKSHRNFFIPTP